MEFFCFLVVVASGAGLAHHVDDGGVTPYAERDGEHAKISCNSALRFEVNRASADRAGQPCPRLFFLCPVHADRGPSVFLPLSGRGLFLRRGRVGLL